MPTFIDNKGDEVVPSLAALAVANGGLKESDVTCLDSTRRILVQEEIQRMGYHEPRGGDQPLLTLANDLSAKLNSCHWLKICFLRPYQFNRVTYFSQNPSRNRAAKTKWEATKQKIASSVNNIALVFLMPSDVNPNLMQFRAMSRGQQMLVISHHLLAKITDEGVNLRPIQRLLIGDVDQDDFLSHEYFSLVPAITHLNIVKFTADLTPILQVKETLQELRMHMRPHISGVTFAEVLSQMSALRLLLVDCTGRDDLPFSIDWDLLELSLSLRSLTLLGIAPATATNIIGFLTKEVNHKGNAVERQELLDDLTVTGVKKEVMEEIYRSDALTGRMKERIFCDVTLKHMASTLLAVSKKMNYGLGESLGPLFRRTSQLLVGVEKPPLIIFKVVLEVINQTTHCSCIMDNGFPLLNHLLETEQDITYYGSDRARWALDTLVGAIQKMQDEDINDETMGAAFKLLVNLTDWGIKPSSSSNFLKAVITLMHSTQQPDELLPSLFLTYAQKLSPPDLDACIDGSQRYLSNTFFKMLTGYKPYVMGQAVVFRRTVAANEDMIKMLNFILLHTENTYVKIAANAFLRRSTVGPFDGAWHDSYSVGQELGLYYKLQGAYQWEE